MMKMMTMKIQKKQIHTEMRKTINRMWRWMREDKQERLTDEEEGKEVKQQGRKRGRKKETIKKLERRFLDLMSYLMMDLNQESDSGFQLKLKIIKWTRGESSLLHRRGNDDRHNTSFRIRQLSSPGDFQQEVTRNHTRVEVELPLWASSDITSPNHRLSPSEVSVKPVFCVLTSRGRLYEDMKYNVSKHLSWGVDGSTRETFMFCCNNLFWSINLMMTSQPLPGLRH